MSFSSIIVYGKKQAFEIACGGWGCSSVIEHFSCIPEALSCLMKEKVIDLSEVIPHD